MGKNLYANAHPKALTEVKKLVEGTIAGDRVAKTFLLERLGTVDGYFAFANLSNVAVQKNYANSQNAIWQKFATRTTVDDFRDVTYIDFSDLDFRNMKAADKGVARPAGVLPEVAEGEKYQSFTLSTSTATGFSVKKHGAQIGFTWEAFVNDPYNTVRRLPTLLAASAWKTVDYKATSALYTAADAQPHLAATTAGNGLPAVTADSALSLASLIAAVTQLAQKKDPHGNAVTAASNGLVLSVDPGLAPTARWILSQRVQVTRSATGSGSNNYTETQADVSGLGNIEVVENPYLHYYAGNTSTWVLSPAGGSDGTGADAVSVAFLAGEEEPEIRASGLAGYTPNGQALPFTSGSFDQDTFDLRVRHLSGAGSMNGLPLILSDGTGALS